MGPVAPSSPQPPPEDVPRGVLDADQARRFRESVLVHADAAYNLALRLARRPDLAEDITHDAYLRALAAFPRFRGGDARAWLLTIVRNRFYDWAREQRARRVVPMTRESLGGSAEEDWDMADPDQETAEEALVRQGEAGALLALVDRLPPAQREVIVLREMEELGYREIAAITAAPIGSVMSRLARGRAALAKAWRAREAAMMEAGA